MTTTPSRRPVAGISGSSAPQYGIAVLRRLPAVTDIDATGSRS